MVKTLTGQNASLFSPDVYTHLWDTEIDRSAIRNQIVISFSNELKDHEKQNILDLKQLPKSEKHFFSISHSPVGSGFVAHKNPIGLDIEKISRTKKLSLIKRISTEDEIKLFNENWFLIWSIKESAFKRMSQSNAGLTTMSQITIKEVDFNKSKTLSARVNFENKIFMSDCYWDHQKVICVCK